MKTVSIFRVIVIVVLLISTIVQALLTNPLGASFGVLFIIGLLANWKLDDIKTILENKGE